MRRESEGSPTRWGWVWCTFAAAVVFVVGCQVGGGRDSMAIEMSEFKFQPNEITASTGQPATLSLRNRGTVVHDFVVRELDIASPKIQPGQSVNFSFTPSRTGTFQFVCTEPGHEQAGMVGTLAVK